MVTVTATDAAGISEDQMVTISINNVEEPGIGNPVPGDDSGWGGDNGNAGRSRQRGNRQGHLTVGDFRGR